MRGKWAREKDRRRRRLPQREGTVKERMESLAIIQDSTGKSD